ncbi:MAG: DUF1345 domain-containing protein [Sphingomicrobium sp.]
MLLSIINHVMPWRFALFFLVLLAVGPIALPVLGWSQGSMVGFDIAAVMFLASCFPMFCYDVKRMREVATENDANRVVLLILSFLLTVVILAAMVVELSSARDLQVIDKLLITVSLVIVWTFGNAVYTLHYCHLFYTRADHGKDSAGLKFPATKLPLMSDFVYFAYTLGVAVQTSDVQVTSPHIRKVVTAHCVAGFFFNLGVLALTINVLGSS